MLMPQECYDSLKKRRLFAWDIETEAKAGVPPSEDNNFSPRTARIEGMSVKTEDGVWDWDCPPEADPLEDIGEFLDDPKKFCIVWNYAFEATFYLWYRTWFPKCRIFDGMIGLHLMDERRHSYELKIVAPELIGFRMMKYEQALKYKYSLFPEERKLWNVYRQEDVVGPWDLVKDIIFPQLKKEGLMSYYWDIEGPLIEINVMAALIGAKVDIPLLVREKKLLKDPSKGTGKIYDAEKEVYKLAGQEFNIGSPKQLSQVLFDKLKLSARKYEARWSPKSQQYQTGKDILRRMAGDGVPIAQAILDYRLVSKEYSGTYVPLIRELSNKFKNRNGIMHPKALQHKQTTGRMSYKPSVTTIFPRPDKSDARKAVKARKGHKLIIRDLSQAELRMMADASQDPTLMGCYHPDNPIDVHTKTQAACGMGDLGKKGRTIAKSVNFGKLFRIGAKKLKSDLYRDADITISLKEAKGLLKSMDEAYPGILEFQKACEKHILKYGQIRTMKGRVARLKDEIRQNEYHAVSSGINHPIQGGVAEIMKMAMIAIYRQLSKEGLYGSKGFRILFQVHDELVCEAPTKIAKYCDGVVKHHMENVVQLSVPLVATGGIYNCWFDAK